jgi:GNAT superfamily N-acetyltransferase
MTSPDLIPYAKEWRGRVVDLAIRAWAPVLHKTRDEVPGFVFDAFYPQGWQARQEADVTAMLDGAPETVWLAVEHEELVGFLGLRLHPEDRMGEIHILAVAPERQRQGVGRMLTNFAETYFRERGMRIVMVETVADSGHEPARRAYESSGYQRWPVARYFKPL